MSLNSVAIGILFLPCFFLLVLVSEALTRLATRAMQMHARHHFDWPQGSLFSRCCAAPPMLQQCKEQLGVTRYKHCGGTGRVQCVFCLNDMSDGEEMRELRCRHIFHRTCLDEWLEHKWATCPVCRDWLVGTGDAEGDIDHDQDQDQEQEQEMALMLMSSYYRHNWWMW